MSSPMSELYWIRPPRQARTQQSLERLLDAAEEMLREKEFDDIHVSEVARRANTSVAGFYRRFKDKDALLHALHERFNEEAFATADDALAADRWQGAGIAEILVEIFPFLIKAMQSHEALDRAIYQRALTDELMRERSRKLTRYVVDGLSALLLDRRVEIHHPNPELAVRFALLQAVAFLTQHYTVGVRDVDRTHMSDTLIARELSTSCLAYFGVRDPHAPFGGEAR